MSKYYAIYYMITPRCILNCGYCFRDTTPESIRQELPIEKIKEVITHLYEKFNVRKLTISGGEPTVVGGVKNKYFLEMMEHIRQFKSPNPKDNLRIELLSNAVNLTEDIADQLVDIVERITITLDTLDDDILTKIGRNTGEYKYYIKRFQQRFEYFYSKGFQLKLHSVITAVNYEGLNELVKTIVNVKNFKISKWKFYQYMTYGQPEKDLVYAIEDNLYKKKCEEIRTICKDSDIVLSFKDNKLMAESMFNLLHTGRMENFSQDNGERIRHLSKIITEYKTLDELIEDNKINKTILDKYHTVEL